MAKILVVEDNVETIQAIRDILHFERHNTDLAPSAEDGWDFIKTYDYDLLIFDWELPKMSGVELLKKYRASGGKTPVIMLTGKTDTPDKIAGLDSGADNYLTKPFGSEELLAHVRATLRRTPENVVRTVTFGDLCLDEASSMVRCGDKSATLSSREVKILKILMDSKNSIVSHDQLRINAWPDSPDVSPNTMRVFLTSFREKLASIGSNTKILSARGYGYQIKE